MKKIIILLFILVLIVTGFAQSPADWTIVGTLAYGQTVGNIAYKNPAKYRAFKFEGKNGDQIDIWVRSGNGDAVAWVINDQFKILALNDDGDGTTSNAHITFTLPGNSNPASFTYYLVFRDYNLESANFNVILNGWQQKKRFGNTIATIKQIGDSFFNEEHPDSNNNRSGGWDTKNNTAEKHETGNALLDKPWEIKPDLIAKGATGRLYINIPKDAECVITISQPVTERQVVYSVSDRSFSLVPGTYDVTVSGKKTKEVVVQKGRDTRIKAGTLNVVASGTWTLYDEKRDRQVYYSVSTKKIGLPAGMYQLEINGTTQQIKITDGETVDF